MLRRIANKLLGIALSRPLPPPSKSEKDYLSDLQATFRELPTMSLAKALPSEMAWLKNMNRLKELVLTKDPRKFLRWDVVTKTMFVSNANYIANELNYLKSLPNWETRWRSAIKESFTGHPTPYIRFPSSSGNLIHHAYHIAQFEEKTGCSVQKMDFIFEFGGGYGSLCRLCHNMGFRGRYLIFDLPQFSALQTYYLKALGLPLQSTSAFLKSRTGIVCISDHHSLQTILENHIPPANNLFIATWSISETPIDLRDKILPLVHNFQSFLIGFQDKFGEVNNFEYFANLKAMMKNVTWTSWQINHLSGNHYLVGTRIEK